MPQIKLLPSPALPRYASSLWPVFSGIPELLLASPAGLCIVLCCGGGARGVLFPNTGLNSSTADCSSSRGLELPILLLPAPSSIPSPRHCQYGTVLPAWGRGLRLSLTLPSWTLSLLSFGRRAPGFAGCWGRGGLLDGAGGCWGGFVALPGLPVTPGDPTSTGNPPAPGAHPPLGVSTTLWGSHSP